MKGIFYLFLASLVSAQCQVRQEWRQLSPAAQRNYIRAVNQLMNRPAGSQSDPTSWNQEQFSQVHVQYYASNHGKDPFFPWHRHFIQNYENALRTIDPSITLPYWDWTTDSQNPQGSPLLQDSSFGGNGDSANGNCVNTGVVKGWTTSDNQCIKRCNNWSALYPPASVGQLYQSSADFHSFSNHIETGPHGVVHNQLGGSCGQFSYPSSALEPIFFLHHAMVDKLWWKWQSCSTNAQSYSGSPSDVMTPFGPVQDTFNTNGGKFCYTYSNSVVDQGIQMQCPGGRFTNGPGGTPSSSVPGPVPTATNSAASPTPTVDPLTELWLQNWIISLVPGQTKITSTKTATNATLFKRSDATTPYNETYVAPPSTDRCNMIDIRVPGQLTPDYMERMGVDKDVAQETFELARKAVVELNASPDKWSPVALTHWLELNPNSDWIPGCQKDAGM